MMWTAIAGMVASIALANPVEVAGPLLLADDGYTPQVRLSWTTSSGVDRVLEAELPYASPAESRHLGENIDGYVALGGTRLEKGAGHPDGAILRFGISKVAGDKAMFEDIASGTSVRVELRNAMFNQPVTPDPDSILQRMEYQVDDVVACGLTLDETEMFNMASEDDDMGGAIPPRQIRFSVLDGSDPRDGRVTLRVEENGSVTMLATLPYGLLRHKSDPWLLEVPGTFFEPIEMDIECEILPADIAAAEGVRLPAAEVAD